MESRLDFSVIFLSKNSMDTVEKSIKSLVNQKKKNIEILVLDGGSTDSTINILDRYKSEFDYYCSEYDDGPVNAINKGLKIARGRYLIVMSSDDMLQNGYFDNLNKYISYNSDVISTPLLLVGNNISYKFYNGINDLYFSYKKILFSPLSNSRIIKKEIYERLGGYDENYKFCSDLDFLLKVASIKDLNFIDIDGPGYVFLVHDKSRTSGGLHLKEIYYEEIRIYFKNLKLNIYIFFVSYLMLRLIKKIAIWHIKLFLVKINIST